MLELNFNQLWDKVLKDMIAENRISKPSYDTWLSKTSVIACDGSTYIVHTENEFSKNSLEYYLKDLCELLERYTNSPAKISFVTQRNPDPEAILEAEREANAEKEEYDVKEISRIHNLNPDYTFENFVIGKSNQFAHAGSLAIAESMSHDLNCHKMYNPMFIYGGSGLGKTHLMHAVAHHVLMHQKDAHVIYATSEKFMNELIDSLGATRNKTNEFREKYRNVDLLLIDDIQFLKKKESTQEEFFHTFNELYQSNKQIMITSDRPPQEIKELEERLRTRFQNGLICDIQPPDLETRIAILRKKAQAENREVPDEVTLFMGEHIQSNIRELEGALITVTTYANLHNIPVTVDLARDVLQDYMTINERKTINIKSIIDLVCKTYGIRYEDIVGKKRQRNIAFPRQVAMYLCRELTDNSLPKIGENFGNRDHTTIMHGVDKIKNDMDKDPALKASIKNLINTLTEDS